MTAISLEFFSNIQKELDVDSETRDQLRQEVRELDRACRTANAVLNRVHTDPKHLANEVAKQADQELVVIRGHLQRLSSLLPEHKYYKYADMWNRSVQQACFITAVAVYLHEERLVSAEEMAATLQVPFDMTYSMTSFHLSIEDYLHALCSLTNELSRLAINAVTAGDFAYPFRVSNFVKELHASFQLLNLKNDALRKRFDGIKYDVKRIEEVVYDLTLRGFKPNTDTPK
ncbi:hypothetical protein BDF19DRAFT_446087 [Syncephalis fuscata]|nr:hypothetical protein BDF19DRAFT_446087 [Syncephalis fuscata]